MPKAALPAATDITIDEVVYQADKPTLFRRLGATNTILLSTLFWLVFAFFNTWAFLETKEGVSYWTHFFDEYLMCLAYWSTWGPGTILVMYLSRRFCIGGSAGAAPIVKHIVFGVALSTLQTTFYIFVSPLIQMPICNCAYSDVLAFYSIPRMYLSWHLLYGQLIYWGIVGAEHAVRHYRREQAQRLRAAQLEAQASAAQLESLVNRLHPHFLFNSFHTMVSLMETGQYPAARDMAVGLCDLLRKTLSTNAPALVTFAEELEFITAYLNLEQVRFADRMSYQIEVDPDVRDALVPRLLLQPLVENAVRHGVAVSEAQCTIIIRGHRDNSSLIIVIENAGTKNTPQNSPRPGLGMGLHLTKERLAWQYGDQQTFSFIPLELGGARVTMSLPLEREGD